MMLAEYRTAWGDKKKDAIINQSTKIHNYYEYFEVLSSEAIDEPKKSKNLRLVILVVHMGRVVWAKFVSSSDDVQTEGSCPIVE
jgi:hypothetical protein